MTWFNYVTPFVMVLSVWVAYRLGKRGRLVRDAEIGANDLERARVVVRDLEQIAQAYDEIRLQTSQLTVPEPKPPSADLLSQHTSAEILKLLFAMKGRYNTRFSIALISIDTLSATAPEVQSDCDDSTRPSFLETLQRTVRDTDVVVNFGSEEFLVVLTETDLPGACVFGQRLRDTVSEQLAQTVSVGVAEASDGDTRPSLLSRTDSALYSAKSSGGDCVYFHTGRHIERAKPLRDLSAGKQPPAPAIDTAHLPAAVLVHAD